MRNLSDTARQNFTREAQRVTLATGKSHDFFVRADWFFVHKCQENTEAGDDVEIDMAVNDRGFAPVKRGEPGQGVNIGAGEIWKVTIINTTANPVFFRLIFGMGARPYSPETRISNPSLALSAATIAALADAINNPVELIPFEDSALAADKTYADCKGIEIEALGPDDTGEVELPDGTFQMAMGEIRSWSVENDSDWIADIIVHGAANTKFRVTGLQYP